MSTGFPSYSGSPWVNRCDDYSPDSGFNSAYSSTFGSTGSRLGSSQDVDIHSGSKFGEFVHGKSPSWPVTHVTVKPSPGHPFPSSRSTSWPGQMKMENGPQSNATKSFFSVAGEKYRDKVSDVTRLGERAGDCDLASRATHSEETLSPESARRIFREATARNERLRSNRYSTSFLHSTPEKPQKVFLRPSPTVADKTCAVSKASCYNGLYGDVMGDCSSPSLREFNDLASCGRRITLPREHTSSFETLKSIQKYSNEVENLSTGGALGQFGLSSQVCHHTSSPIDQLNSDPTHRISGAPLDQQVPSGFNGEHDNVGSFSRPGYDLSKLSTPVQLQRQWSDWNQKPVRFDHSPDASPRGFVFSRAAQSLRNDALIRTSRSPNEGAHSAFVVNESLSKSHDGDLDGTGDVGSNKATGSGMPMVQQIERLSLSRTSVLRKLSHEFYGQSAKHNHGLVNHALLRAKHYRRFGSVDETGHEVTDNPEMSPLAHSTSDGDRRQSDAEFRSPCLKPCHNGNGVSLSGSPEVFTAVGVVTATLSPTTGSYLPPVPETNIGPVDSPGVESNYHPDTQFQKLNPDKSFEKKLHPVGLNDQNTTTVVSHDSPPPPDLPPRKYRESDDVKSVPVSAVLQVQGLDLLGTNDEDDFDSTADDYAEQLRRQAKRLSHSHSSIFTMIHSPRVEQVALPGDHVGKLVDHASQGSSSSQSSGFAVELVPSPRVEQFLLQSPNSSHCDVLPNGRHAITVASRSDDACSTVLTVNGVKESPGMGKLREDVTTRKPDKISCAKNLFGSDARLSGKSSVSDGIISVEEGSIPDIGRRSVCYGRSVSSPENKGSAPKGHDYCIEEKSLGMERKSEKNSNGERNHLGRVGRSPGIDSRVGRKFSDKESNSSSHERNSLSQERKGSSQERKGTSQERKSASHGRKSASQGRKGVSQERKCAGQERKSVSQERTEEHISNRGRKNLNEGRDGKDIKTNHSNEERQSLSKVWNSSSVEKQGSNTDKNAHSNQERSLSHDRKTGSCKGYSAIRKGKDLNQELHDMMYGNEIHRMCQVGIRKSPEETTSTRGEIEGSSHKRSSGVKRTGFNFLSDEILSTKAEDVTEEQKTTDLNCTSRQLDLGDKRFDLKSRPACDGSVVNLEKNAASPSTSKRETVETVSHAANSGVNAQRHRNKEKVCKMGNDMEPHRDCHLKKKTPTVTMTETLLVISSSCDANNAITKPLDSIIKVVSSRHMKPGNPTSEVGMTKTKLVHSKLEGKAVIRGNRAEPVVDNADLESIGAVRKNDSPALLLNGKQGTASAKIQGDFDPCSSRFQGEIPSFLSDVLPVEHKTATYYLAQLVFNNILSTDVEREACSPAVRTSIQPYLRYLSEKAVASSTSFENLESSGVCSDSKHGTDELSVVRKIDDKLKDFEREKQSIECEVIENVALGQKLTSLAEEKLEPKEFGKFKLYVDEMDKVLCLLLNVTKRLSSVETSIRSLPMDGSSTNERAALVSKRDDLSQKYEDALALSEGIALRRHQVADYLVKCLSDKDFKSFEHFVEAKLRLFLERQTVEDIVNVVRSKLQSIRSNGALD